MRTFKQLQEAMPYTETLWSQDFKDNPIGYKGFLHCLTNIAAKLGALFSMTEMEDHGHCPELGLDKYKAGVALAFIIMSAMKAANVYPGGPIDLSEFIESDLKRRGH